VCVLRPRLAPAKLVFLVHDNGRLVGATRGSSYFCYLAEPGPHRIRSSRLGVAEEVLLLAEAGRRYYLYQNVDPFPDTTRSWLSWTSEGDARVMAGEASYRILASAGAGEEPPGERPMARADPSLDVPPAPAAQAPAQDSPPEETLPPPVPAPPPPAAGQPAAPPVTPPVPGPKPPKPNKKVRRGARP
jgi:hypothetical protein